MKSIPTHIWFIVALLIVGAGVELVFNLPKSRFLSRKQIVSNSEVVTKSTLVTPVDGFWERITKKPFGIYITPKTSPVQPEKFTGYHTGTDVEFDDVAEDVSVRTIADGKVVISRTATGYGGITVIDHRPEVQWYSLYGHLAPTSLPKNGTLVKGGEVIGKLAPAYSTGSGGERKHLHFAIITQSVANIAGYVSTIKELSGWQDAKTILAR